MKVDALYIGKPCERGGLPYVSFQFLNYYRRLCLLMTDDYYVYERYSLLIIINFFIQIFISNYNFNSNSNCNHYHILPHLKSDFYCGYCISKQ